MSAPIDQPDWQNPQSGMAVTTTLVSAFNLAVNGSLGPYDLSAYSALIITALPQATPGFAWLDVVDSDTEGLIAQLTTPTDNPTVEMQPIVVPVQTKHVRIDNLSTSICQITVVASNRPNPRPGRLYIPTAQDALFVPSNTQTGVIRMGYGQGSGPASIMARVGGNTIKGLYHLVTQEGTQFIADTTEMHADSTNGQVVYKEWDMPHNGYYIEFAVTTSGVGSLSFGITYE